jgi:hypothetical protein
VTRTVGERFIEFSSVVCPCFDALDTPQYAKARKLATDKPVKTAARRFILRPGTRIGSSNPRGGGGARGGLLGRGAIAGALGAASQGAHEGRNSAANWSAAVASNSQSEDDGASLRPPAKE